MNYNIDKEEIKKLLEKEGEVRGATLLTDKSFIIQNGGEEKIKEVEGAIEEMGQSLSYDEISTMKFYPFGLRVISLLAIAKVFNLDNEGVKKMGVRAPKASFLIKLFTRYFLSPTQTLNKIGEIWNKHATAGEVSVEEINEKEGYAVFHFKGMDFHPLYCTYLSGYLSGAISMALSVKVDVEETKCSFRGNDVHEFKVTWEINN